MSVNYDEYPIEKMIKPILIILFLVVSFSGISQPYNLYQGYEYKNPAYLLINYF